MAGFSGFTDEEIRRLKIQSQGYQDEQTQRKEQIKKVSFGSTGKRGKPREKMRTKQTNISKIDAASSAEQQVATSTKPAANETPRTDEKALDNKHLEEKPREREVIMEPERVKELELSNIEKMQQKQKEMEIINKKKEKVLQYTLKERYKKTKKETETLKLVQKELGHLDNLLYTDVQILRDKIDDACREFDAARKRYDRAETEFINAKVNLHAKTELKDQLMEHLCSIIQENEERKARKLAELMAKLEIGDQDLNEPEIVCEENQEKEESSDVVKTSENVQDSDSVKKSEQVICHVKDETDVNLEQKDKSNNNGMNGKHVEV